MKAIEIEKIYTDKIAEYLANGYTINPATMSGHQGEIAKIDLKKGDEIIRILLDRTHSWDRVNEQEIDAVVLRVGRNTDPFTKQRRPFDTWNTVWNEHLETLEERYFYQINTDADFFTEDLDAYAAMRKRQHQHWRNTYDADRRHSVSIETPVAMKIALRYLKRVTGKARISQDAVELKKVSTGKKAAYQIIYRQRAYTLH